MWACSFRADPRGARLADRHYSRQSPGARQFVPPARCVVLVTPAGDAVWVTTWPRPEYVDHAWPDAWVCTLFRNEGPRLSSDLVRAAVAATRAVWPVPPRGIVTFVDAARVRPKRDPGYCFLCAGWRVRGRTASGLVVLGQDVDAMPAPAAADGAQVDLFREVDA